jgi:hypothetical protein
MGSTTSQTPTGSSTGAGERLTDAASSVAAQAGQTAEIKASGAMQQVSGTLQEIASALRTGTQDLRGQQPQIYGVADTAAQQVERAADYLQSHEPREVLDEVQSIARRQPALLIGGGLALGLVVGRLLRTASSAPGYGGSSMTRGYGSGYQRFDRQVGSLERSGTYAASTGGTAYGTDPSPSLMNTTRDAGTTLETARTGGSARG